MRRRRKKSHRTDSLLDDEWTLEPKTQLYRLQHPYKPRYLGTYLAELLNEIDVMTIWGGGDYFFKVVHRGRVVHRGIFSIEGNPIRGFRQLGNRVGDGPCRAGRRLCTDQSRKNDPRHHR